MRKSMHTCAAAVATAATTATAPAMTAPPPPTGQTHENERVGRHLRMRGGAGA